MSAEDHREAVEAVHQRYRDQTEFVGCDSQLQVGEPFERAEDCGDPQGWHAVKALAAVRLAPEWATESLDPLQKVGQAWNEPERAKIADLNWRIVAKKD